MFISYNGVQLQIEHVTGWSDRNIYSEDGTERLYRHVVLSVQFVIHPQTLAGLGIPNAASAPQIVLTLKRLLLAQRGLLLVNVGGTTVLESPPLATAAAAAPLANGVRLFVDARGGPNPLNCDVVSIHGTQTFLGTWSCETWLVDDTVANEYSSALISHRWQMRNTLDQDYLSTRVIAGKGIFRGDWLYADAPADDFRQLDRGPSDYMAYLNHVVPDGYKRIAVDTEVSSDGLSFSYVVVDQEQPTSVRLTSGISRVEAVWRSGQAKLNSIAGASSWFGALAAAAFTGTSYVALVIRVWGRRAENPDGVAPVIGADPRMASRNYLIRNAIRIAQAMGIKSLINPGLYYSCDLTVDLINKFVELSLSFRVSGIGDNLLDGLSRQVIGASGDKTLIILDDIGFKPFPEDIGDLLIASRSIPTSPPFGGNMGAGQQRLQTQSLRDGNDVPSPTPLPDAQLGNLAVAVGDPDNPNTLAQARGEATH